MDIERALVSKIASTGQVEDVLAESISVDMFADSEGCGRVFQYIVDHKRRHGSAPSLEAIKDDNPDFEFNFTQDALTYLVEKMKVLVKRRMADHMLEQLAKACDDPDESKDIDLHFMDASRQLAMAVPSQRVALFSDMKRRVEAYQERVRSGKTLGIPTGFPTLDEKTGGVKPWQLWSINAFTGIGKSTLGTRFATNFYAQGYTPLIVSLEMDAEEIFTKIESMLLGIDSTAMMNLRLSEDQVKHWEEYADELVSDVADIPVIDSIRSCTVDHVFAEAVRHKPHVVIVDYIQLMRGRSRIGGRGNRWEEIQETAQEFKAVCRMLKIPHIILAQTQRSGAREGATLENVGGSISISQDSDVSIGMHQDEDMREEQEMELRILKNRGGPLGRFSCLWEHETSNYRELTARDIFGRAGKKIEPPPDSEAIA